MPIEIVGERKIEWKVFSSDGRIGRVKLFDSKQKEFGNVSLHVMVSGVEPLCESPHAYPSTPLRMTLAK